MLLVEIHYLDVAGQVQSASPIPASDQLRLTEIGENLYSPMLAVIFVISVSGLKTKVISVSGLKTKVVFGCLRGWKLTGRGSPNQV